MKQSSIKKFFKYHKHSILIFIVTLTIFSIINIYQEAYHAQPRRTTGDEPHYIAITSTILRHQSIFMDDFFLDENPDPNFTFHPSIDNKLRKWHADQRSDGHYVSQHSPGLAYVLIPGYAISGIFGALTTMSLISSFTAVVIFKFTTNYTTTKIGFLTTIIFSFATLLLTWSNQIYADVAMMFFLILILYFIFEKNQSSFYMGISGALLGFGIFLKITFLTIDLVLIPLIFLMFLKHKINLKNFAIFLIFFTFLSVMALLNNFYTYDSLLGGIHTVQSVNILLTGETEEGSRFTQRSEYTFIVPIEIFFGKYHGLFIFSPVVMLFVLGIRSLWDKNNLLLITLVLVSIVFVVSHMIVFPPSSFGGWNPPFRYFILLIPMMAIPFALGFQKFSKSWIYRILLLILLGISVAFSFAFAYDRSASIEHKEVKTQIIHTVYQGIEVLFPSVGKLNFSGHHPLTISNEIFLISMVVLLTIGIIIPFIKKQKVAN